MDMKQLEIFVTACERGSFSQAAACMYMTQPNISKSIRALEHELGRPLLIRNAKGVQPTAYGKIVLEHAQMILKTAATISSLAIPDEQNHLSLSTYPSNMVARLPYNELPIHLGLCCLSRLCVLQSLPAQ